MQALRKIWSTISILGTAMWLLSLVILPLLLWRSAAEVQAFDFGNFEWRARYGIPSTPPPPVVQLFVAEPDTIHHGQVSTLRWRLSGADSASLLDPHAGEEGMWMNVSPSGELTVSPPVTTDYILDAKNRAGTTREVVTVKVLLPPTIDYFRADRPVINQGQTALLSWQVEKYDTLLLNGQDVSGRSEMPVLPQETTRYTLLARSAGGDAAQTLTITVNTAPTIHSFTADAGAIVLGESTTLRWQVEGADTISLDGEDVTGQSAKRVSPKKPHEYVLGAKNVVGEVQKTLTVVVNPRPPVIREFKPNRDTITQGDAVILNWEVENAAGGVFLDGEDVSNYYMKRVTPPETRTYTLVARNAIGQETSKTATVVVNPAGAALPPGEEGGSARLVVVSHSLEGGMLKVRLRNTGTQNASRVSVSLSGDAIVPQEMVISDLKGGATREVALAVKTTDPSVTKIKVKLDVRAEGARSSFRLIELTVEPDQRAAGPEMASPPGAALLYISVAAVTISLCGLLFLFVFGFRKPAATEEEKEAEEAEEEGEISAKEENQNAHHQNLTSS
jgi:hypothetical protein